MRVNPFSYAAQSLHKARHNLMLPHPRGEASSMAGAFHEIWLGFKDMPRAKLDDSARQWVETIEQAMDISGIEDPAERGAWEIKAERLSIDERLSLSSAVDELAYWFANYSD